MAKTVHHVLEILTILNFFSSFFMPAHSTSLNSFVYGGCSQIKYAPDSPYESNLNSLLTSLVNSATYSSYNKYTVMGSSPQDVVYGLYQCRGDLAMPDCATCVAQAVTQLGPLCSQTCGGAIQLEGCFVKYDNATFIGVEDKTAVKKKCGPSDGFNNDEMSRRDAVLSGLNGGGGAYRVGGSEDVQGVAQCVGDLSMGQCQDCLTEAIRRLKGECGGAVFGDMFLAKCYARYSTSGAHVYARSNHDSSDNESEKTFAIIIGLLAGITLFIVFLVFMRRLFWGNGK
ncbi:cysteine-rich repeat secretory protein 60-like [Olea europaea var. sylvestris]|uniref:Cysteine-rich repeat secretory 60-like n=1 Tax=Olea europaea subsp. europaea TaxID=158383 RepID=A0A8S0VBU0_OLEEU|nr:cysteine-rich repeat secretory protein 60-like [Olea europaea var. sylvestris]CAA3027829.1 cysteine-rich repeat secretory 60-like [Olea europaea subsp. europaea]